jgi:hypothetical protein
LRSSDRVAGLERSARVGGGDEVDLLRAIALYEA